LGLKEIYESVEDKYYGIIEKINNPTLTKLVDSIDNIVPSFAVISLIVILLIAAAIIFVIMPLMEENYSFSIQVKNEQGKTLNDINTSIFFDGTEKTFVTDSEGLIELKAKKGTKIKIEIQESRYENYSKEFTLEENEKTIEVELKEVAEQGITTKTLRFKDKSGKYITGKEITIELSCRNSSVKPNPSIIKDTDKDGEIKDIYIPKNCDRLVVDSVEVTGYENWYGTLDSTSAIETIILEEIIIEFEALGDLKVIVQNEEEELLNEIKVSLMQGNSVIRNEYTSYGIAEFTGVKTGYYDLLIEDSGVEYETKKVYSVEIENQEVTEETIEMKRNLKGTLKITVIDETTNALIANARVVVENDLNEVIGDKDTGEEPETVEFALFEDTELTVKVSAEDYLPTIIKLEEMPEEEIIIELEKITSENSGKLKITLVDEDEKAVANARILLKDKEGSILNEYPEKFSDAKGEVNYKGLKEGIYYAYAEKYPASALSEEFEIILTEETEITLTMIVGKAIIELKTIDRYGEAIPNTRVKVKSIDEEKEYTLDSEGTASIEIKADKRVYFEFYDPNNKFALYRTKEYQLLPKNYFIQATMQDQISGESLFVELKGIYLNGEKQETLVGGTKYKAILELFIPTNENYSTAGIHFRTGNDENPFLENDISWIEKINVPKAAKIKGKTWNPKKGQTIDFDSDNSVSYNGKAKWVNIVWTDAEPGVYETEIELMIKDEATENDEITISYRAWGQARDYYYYPADNELGSSSGNSTKQGLYAEVFQQKFNIVEEPPLCEENNLCMTGQQLYDKTEEPFLIQKKLPFEAKTNGVYEYHFKIINESQSVYDEPEAWIKLIDDTGNETQNAEITYYEIKTSEGNSKINNQMNSAATQGISIGFFGRQSVIEGKIGIKTKTAGKIYVNVAMYEKVSGGSNEIFNNEKETGIKIKTGKELQIEIQPEIIPAYVETPIKITVKDGKGIEVEKVIVTLSVLGAGNTKTIISTRTTNRFGETQLTVPILEPKTKIEFKAKKFEYEETTKEVILSDTVFEVSPKTISETLSKRNKPTITKEISITNLLETDFKIESIELFNETGYFEDFINIGKTNAVFSSFKRQTIEAFPQEFVAEIFKAELQTGLPEDYTASAKGIITIKLKNEEFNAVYSEDIKLNLNLGQGEEIAEASCLEIETGETVFSRQTTSQPVSLSYKIVNNCVDDTGKGIKVNNLKAKITWTTKKGEVDLQIDRGPNGQRTATLKTSIYADFALTVNPREEMLAMLTYTPNSELTGEQGTTEFNVIIEAEINTSTGEQVISTNPSSIKGTIGNVELLECIEFDPKPRTGAVIESGAEETQFTITNNCGMDIDLRFCDGDFRCNGRTEEGGITVNPSTTEIRTGANNTEVIEVKRTSMPGIYGIIVDARKAGEAWREIATYDIIVEPEAGYFFDLGDYTIKVPEKKVPDIIELYNTRLFTTVSVDASDCEWETAGKNTQWTKGILMGTGTGATIGAAIGSIIPGLGTVIGGAIGAGLGLIVGTVVCLFGGCPDPCDDRTTEILSDYIINLSGKENPDLSKNPPNLIDINLSFKGIDISWKTEEARINLFQEPNGKETLPLIFEKTTTQYDNIRPSYGIITIDATEHTQRTSLKIPEDRGADIIPFALPDRYSGKTPIHELTEIQRKFHVKIVNKRFIEEIPALNRTLDCIKPDGEIGGLGENALPKIKLDWDWQNISENECVEGNDNYIYCDSTQFAIMLSKRINAIDEFMEENNYIFTCPKNPLGEVIKENWEQDNQHQVAEGKIGIKEIQIETSKENITRVSATIENKLDSAKEITFEANITVPAGVEYIGETFCTKPSGIIGKGKTKEVYCEFKLPQTSQPYGIEIRHITEEQIENLSEEELEKYDQYVFDTTYRIGQSGGICWAGTSTGDEGGLFPLDLYINAFNGDFAQYVLQKTVQDNGKTVSTDKEEILSTIEKIEKLSHFNAYLIKDGFTKDFKTDFADYYENKVFLGSSTWFTDSDPETTNNELAEYFKQDGLLSFNRKYLSSTEYELPEPGLYRIDLSIDYAGSKWKLFDSTGQPNAVIKVEFTRLNTPNADSIFYYLPFDGKIGEENYAYHRIGYGTGYNNLREEELKINSDTVLAPSNTLSTPLNEISIEKSDSLIEMNSNQETRGSILHMGYDGDEMQLTFYPSKATPVALKMWHEQTSTTEQEINYYYGMQESLLPIIAGNEKLAYWKGLGACRDFEGKFVQNYKKWDVKAESTVTNFQNLYGVKWNNAINGGNTYLKTVFYTPIERNISLKVNPGNSVQDSSLFTPNESESESVGLNGIAGMQYNNSMQSTTDYLNNIQKVFDLVKQGTACISQNDVSMNIYWNEPNLFRQKGSVQSINEIEDSLIAGQNCIE